VVVREVVGKQAEVDAFPKGGGAAGGVSAISVGLRLLGIGPLLILIVLTVLISLLTPNFLKPINIGNILAQTAVIAIVAVGQHLVILRAVSTSRSARTWRSRPSSVGLFSKASIRLRW
jgi:hypothetical protein